MVGLRGLITKALKGKSVYLSNKLRAFPDRGRLHLTGTRFHTNVSRRDGVVFDVLARL